MTESQVGVDATTNPVRPEVVGAGHPDGAVVVRQGRYAGIISRSVATAIDAVVLAIVSFGTLFVLQAVVAMIKGVPFVDITIDPEWGVVIVVFQAGLYFTAAWATFGRTAGEALFGLRVIRRTGVAIGWGRSFLRFLLTPLAYSFCGLGYVWILIDKRRRTWTDLAVGTVVVYDWRKADLRVVEPVTILIDERGEPGSSYP